MSSPRLLPHTHNAARWSESLKIRSVANAKVDNWPESSTPAAFPPLPRLVGVGVLERAVVNMFKKSSGVVLPSDGSFEAGYAGFMQETTTM